MNKEFKFIASKSIPTDLFGCIKIVCVLVYYDYPRAFIGKNDSHYFALTEFSDDLDSFGWDLTIVSTDDINEVNKGLKSMQSLFRGKESYILSNDKDQSFCCAKRVEKFSGKYEVRGDTFIQDFCDMDEVFDYHNLWKNALEKKDSSLSLVLENSECSNTGFVLKAINYIGKICKSLKNSIDISDSVLMVYTGSIVITFEFRNSDSNLLLPSLASANSSGLNDLGNLLSANDFDQLISSLPSSNNFNITKKYTKMVDNFENNLGNRPKVVIADSEKKNAISFKFDKNNCKNKIELLQHAKETIKKETEIEKTEIKAKGIFKGIMIDGSNTFVFVDNNNNLYKGNLDFSLVSNNKSFSVNGTIYEVKIIKTILRYNGDIQSYSYTLLDYEKIDDIALKEQLKLF